MAGWDQQETKPHQPSWVPDEHYTPAPAKDINLTPDDPQWVCIASNSLHWNLYCMLGDGDVSPDGGGATFDNVTVPQRKTILEFSGVDLWRLTVPLMFDAWEDDLTLPSTPPRKRPPSFKSVDKAKKRRRLRARWRRYRDRHNPQTVQQYVDLINKLAQPRGRRKGPPIIRVYGKALPNHLNGEPWLITQLEWGKYLHGREGVLRRQAFVLNLTEPNEGDQFSTKQRKRKHAEDDGHTNQHTQWYTVKQGDTLQEIAAKFYGDPHKWERIARANDIKNPRKLHDYVGKKIMIPDA